MKNTVKIYHPEAVNLFNENTVITELSSGFKFADGPLWHPEGYLMISDLPQNRIFQLYRNGVIHVPLYNSGGMFILYTHLSEMIGSNGLALDKEQNLVFCQHGSHGIAKMDKAKNITQLCSSFNGKPFNSPYDIVLKSDGAVFFTDPPYGLKNQVLNPGIFQPHSGLYRYFDNQVSLLSTDLKYPNGLCFSKDEKYLFLSSNHPEEKIIYKYEFSAYGKIIRKNIFAYINAAGIKIDRYNNLYAATNEGVVILSPKGEKLALIELNGLTTNIAFGGNEESLLFVTTPFAVYYLQLDYNPARSIKNKPFEKNAADSSDKLKRKGHNHKPLIEPLFFN